MSEKIQLNLFENNAVEDATYLMPSQTDLWGMWLADELTLDQWTQITNYLYPLSPEELDRLSPRRRQIEERITHV